MSKAYPKDRRDLGNQASGLHVINDSYRVSHHIDIEKRSINFVPIMTSLK